MKIVLNKDNLHYRISCFFEFDNLDFRRQIPLAPPEKLQINRMPYLITPPETVNVQVRKGLIDN
jgi:hypothetical protein